MKKIKKKTANSFTHIHTKTHIWKNSVSDTQNQKKFPAFSGRAYCRSDTRCFKLEVLFKWIKLITVCGWERRKQIRSQRIKISNRMSMSRNPRNTFEKCTKRKTNINLDFVLILHHFYSCAFKKVNGNVKTIL